MRLALLLLLLGCHRGQQADLGPTCEDTPTVVAHDEVTALGFSADDLLALGAGDWSDTFTWAHGGTTPVTLSVAWNGGEARYVASEAVYPDTASTLDIGIECPDRVEIDVSAHLVTGDGAFDETLAAPLRAEIGTKARLHADLDPNALTGTYDVTADITEPTWDEVKLWFDATFDPSGSSGAISGQVSGQEDCQGDTCTAWAAELPVGSWGVPTD